MAYPVDDNGNIRVDFVWGNMAMQPDEQRGNSYDDSAYTVEGGWATKSLVGNTGLELGWEEIVVRNGDQSDDGNVRYDIVEYGVHDIIDTGYSNYPAFIENYAGDGDTGLERVVPDLKNVARADMQAVLAELNLGFVADDVFVGATLANDGKFKAQSPAKNTIVADGSNVGVSFYEAPTVPNLVDFDSVSAAGDALGLAGLVLGTVTTSTVGATSGNNNWVKSQSIAAGTKVAAGTVVNLVEYDYVAPTPATTGPFQRMGYDAGSDRYYFFPSTPADVVPVGYVGSTFTIANFAAAPVANGNYVVDDIVADDAYNTGGQKVWLQKGGFTWSGIYNSAAATWTLVA